MEEEWEWVGADERSESIIERECDRGGRAGGGGGRRRRTSDVSSPSLLVPKELSIALKAVTA